MKKRTILIFTLISILAMVAGSAMTSNAPRSIRYLDSRFINGKGAVFLFETTGEFTKQDMKTAFAYGNGGDPLNAHCVVQADKSRIACTVSNVNKYDEVMLSILGQGFWASVPRPKECLGFTFTRADWDVVGADPWLYDYYGLGSADAFFAYYEGFGWIFPNKCVTDASLFSTPK